MVVSEIFLRNTNRLKTVRGDGPKISGGSPLWPREYLNQSDRSDRTAEHPEHRCAPDRVPRRQVRELTLRKSRSSWGGEVVAGLITGLAQREGIVWHEPGMPEDGCSIL
jgi:hypothetical protein